MLTLRKSQDRGHADHGWLESYHSFSFADYYDPEHMGFGNLRVINEDRIAPGTGFGTHGHRDMEIISYVLSGELGAQGHAWATCKAHPARRRAAHERRHAACSTASSTTPTTETTHFLQIWIQPNVRGIRAELRAEDLRRRGEARPAAAGRVARRRRRLGADPRGRAHLRGPVRWRRKPRARARSEAQDLRAPGARRTRSQRQAARGRRRAMLEGESQLTLGDGKDAEVLVFDLQP